VFGQNFYSNSEYYVFLGCNLADNFFGIFLNYGSKISLTRILRRGFYDWVTFTWFPPVIRPLVSTNRRVRGYSQGREVLFWDVSTALHYLWMNGASVAPASEIRVVVNYFQKFSSKFFCCLSLRHFLTKFRESRWIAWRIYIESYRGTKNTHTHTNTNTQDIVTAGDWSSYFFKEKKVVQTSINLRWDYLFRHWLSLNHSVNSSTFLNHNVLFPF
jgi:hypothetical protein